MFSRRSFLLAGLGLAFSPALAMGKKKQVLLPRGGPHTLARQEWPPAIQPDYLTVTDRGNALISDQSGRLAVVDFKREEGPLVLGELTGLGKKTIDVATMPGFAYAIADQEVNGENQHILIVINLLATGEPAIIARIPLSYFSEPTAIAVGPEVYAVGGVSSSGQNQVVLYGNSNRKPHLDSSTPVATLPCSSSVRALDYQDRQLSILLSSGSVTELDVYNIASLPNPVKTASIRLDGDYQKFVRSHDMAAVAGLSNDRKCDVRIISFKPTAHIVSRINLPVSEIRDIALQKGQILILANQAGRLVVMPVTYGGKGLQMAAQAAILLPPGPGGAGAKYRMAASGKDAYVASDSGVQLLNINKGGWQFTYSHTIPRLPAAAISAFGNRAVIGGANLQVFSISQPEHPVLIEAVELGSAIRAVQLMDNHVVALTRDNLSLRYIDKPSDMVSSIKISGQGLAYDSGLQCVYVIAAKQKTTSIYRVRAGNKLDAAAPLEIEGSYQHIAVERGRLLLCGLNTMALYSAADRLELISSRIFPNLAIRDAALVGNNVFVTAIDASSRGFLLVINAASSELNTLGSVDLPQDGVALAASARHAIVVGRSNGKDVASLIDLSNVVAPRITESFPVLDHASAVVIRDRLALVAGRGLEILNI